jgi:hypothetical protein
MGQPITVQEKTTSRPDLLRFEINRSLTGMGHEHYASLQDALGERPPDQLARRLFQKGGVRSVHIFSNVVDVEVEPGARPSTFVDVIRDLYIHYREGVTPSVT